MWLLLSCSPASLTLGTDSTPLPTIQDSDPVVESEPIDSIGPADTNPEDSDAPDGPDELLYEPARVLQLTITLTNQNYNALRRDGHSFVDAELSYGDWTGPVQIHIKGSSTWQEIDAKPSLVVDVDNLAPGFEFMGEEKFYLHNQCYDPSMYSEQLSYNFYREQGYPASRTNFARLTLNGEDYGFYSIVEPHEDDFLRIWFDDPNGNLYENAEAYCDVWDLRCMEVEENDEGNDDALRALGAAAQNGAFSEVRPLVDYSRFIEHMALEASISHWD
ncbi:MAG TPA: CotH kinase family protein, partial [Myxococcota bacterium]|nr:CotH kinase family protein [Myxococcota bacterium]